jgi:hypothetical protein
MGECISSGNFQTTFYVGAEKQSSSLAPYHELGHIAHACLDSDAEIRYYEMLFAKRPASNLSCEARHEFLGIGDEYAAICLSHLGYLKVPLKLWPMIQESRDKTQYFGAYKNDIAPHINIYSTDSEKIEEDAKEFNKLVLEGFLRLRQTKNLRQVFNFIHRELYAPMYKQIYEAIEAQDNRIFSISFGHGLASYNNK